MLCYLLTTCRDSCIYCHCRLYAALSCHTAMLLHCAIAQQPCRIVLSQGNPAVVCSHTATLLRCAVTQQACFVAQSHSSPAAYLDHAHGCLQGGHDTTCSWGHRGVVQDHGTNCGSRGQADHARAATHHSTELNQKGCTRCTLRHAKATALLTSRNMMWCS